jgi:hypothetical protein
MKAKNISETDEEIHNTPRHCYFWIATLSDGSVIPEYDFEEPCHNMPRDLPVDFVSRFCWYPVTLTMIDRVYSVFGEWLVLPFDGRIHTLNIDLEDGERLRTKPVWRNTKSFLGGSGVTVKYALFKTTKDKEIVGFFLDEHGQKINEDI